MQGIADVLRAVSRVRRAQDDEERAEADADLEALGRQGPGLAALVALAKIQVERPMVLPMAAMMCGWALVQAVRGWVS